MRRSSPYFPLATRVDYRDRLHPWWDTIAAFNSENIAISYAANCRKHATDDREWRVMKRVGNRWVEVK